MRYARSFPLMLSLLLAACGGSPAPTSAPGTATSRPSAPALPAPSPFPAASTPAPTPTATAPASGSATAYQFTLVLLPGTDTRVRQALGTAMARWQKVVTAEVGKVSVNLPAGACGNAAAYSGSVGGMVIFAGNENIDGAGRTLAESGPCVVRANNGLTAAATLIFDTADLDQFGDQLGQVATHELGHSLGIGSLWDTHGLLKGTSSSDPRYTGANALREYAALGGTLGSIPLENGGGSGTADSHWREKTFGNELMTGYLNSGFNPLSRMTIGSLQDLGYAVDYSAADSYSPGQTVNTLALTGGPGPNLADHIRHPAVSTLPLR